MVKAVSRSHLNGGCGADFGPPQGDPCRRTIRPIATSKAAIPIIEEGEKPFAMLQGLWIKHRDWVFQPIHYSSVDALIASLDE